LLWFWRQKLTKSDDCKSINRWLLFFFLTSINDYSLYLKLFLLGFAQRICDEYGGPNPRRGKKNDEAHPPIHPTKYSANLQGWNF